MKQVLIIEDEQVTASNLKRMLIRYDAHIQVLGVLSSVSEAIHWLINNPQPDLIFLDVQLGDGLSFEIFDDVELITPIIFTTAYDEYLQQSFELNSIDYLLKPYSFERLAKALDKFKKLYEQQMLSPLQSHQIPNLIDWQKPAFKARFLVKIGSQLRVIPSSSIAYFVKDDLVLLIDDQGGKYAMSQSLDELGKQVNPAEFFRINRQYLVHFDSIHEIHQDGQQITLYLKPLPYTHTKVSQRNMQSFKQWLESN